MDFVPIKVAEKMHVSEWWEVKYDWPAYCVFAVLVVIEAEARAAEWRRKNPNTHF